MNRKIMASCVSLVALVALAVVPAMASASPVLTEGGVAVGVGAGITGSSSNLKFTSSSGNVECKVNHMAGKVSENSGTSIKGNIETAEFNGGGGAGCTSTSSFASVVHVTIENLPWCLESTGKTTWTLTGNACGLANKTIGFILHFTLNGGGTLTCTYGREDISGTTDLNVTTSQLTIGASQTFTKSEGGFLCPGSGTLEGSFTLTTTAGGALTIS